MTEDNAPIEDTELTEQINKTLNQSQLAAEKEAQQRIKKHKREIKRLNEYATSCLINDKKEGYIYCISKLRSIINKPVSRDILESLWKTSRERVVAIMAEGK